MIAASGISGALIALVAVYGIAGLTRNAGEEACRPALAVAKRLNDLARGEVAAVKATQEPRFVPDLAFRDASAGSHRLAEWRGRVALVNLWATWCIPCRTEMPALDALQTRLGGNDFEVVAINIDTRDPDKPRQWLKDNGIDHLTFYADPSAKAFQELKAAGRALGMPTTLLIDARGCELASLAGPADWASDDAIALIRTALGGERLSATIRQN